MLVLKISKRLCTLCILAALCSAGCSSNQSVKNAWKGTKGMWYTYVSPPASIDYAEKGDMDVHDLALATRMMGIDIQLAQLERVMSNADKPPTGGWMQNFFARFPWVSGFTGLKADGTIIGQEPGVPMKPLDFSPLLEEDKKQNLRALRAHVQDTPMGPEVFLAAPLYDAQDFLGVVAAHFDMRALMKYSTNPEDLIILSPEVVLWSGQYDVSSTPLTSVNWKELVLKSTSGTVSSGGNTYYWVVRYLGNQPLIFAIPVNVTTGATAAPTAEGGTPKTVVTPAAPKALPGMGSDEVMPGSKDSVLLPENNARPSPFGPGKGPQERKLD